MGQLFPQRHSYVRQQCTDQQVQPELQSCKPEALPNEKLGLSTEN